MPPDLLTSAAIAVVVVIFVVAVLWRRYWPALRASFSSGATEVGKLVKRSGHKESGGDKEEVSVLMGSALDGEEAPKAGPAFSVPSSFVPLLSREDLRELSTHFPSRVVGKDLSLVFCTRRDGYSLRTLWRCVRGHGPTLIVVMDDGGNVFGGFASRDWAGTDIVTGTHSSGDASSATVPLSSGLGYGGALGDAPASHWARGTVGYQGSPGALTRGGATTYFGSGEAFLFTARPALAVHRWSRANNMFMLARETMLAFGGGGAGFGLFLDGDLERGTSARCLTFNNPPLSGGSDPVGGAFKVTQVEVYSFGVGTAVRPAEIVAAVRNQMSAAARTMRQAVGKRVAT
jgi:hypothetical protein